MSIVKYSTSNIPNTIRANNVAVGINNVGYGPTNTTDFYSGINVPSGGYVVYRFPGGAGHPNIYVAQNDTELINLAGRSNATTVAQAISHINGLSNTIIIDRNYENIVTDGLVLCLDAGTLMSYLRSGTTWRDISGNGNNGTLTNGPTFNSGNGGSIVFDGTNDYVQTNYNAALTDFTVCVWFKVPDSTNAGSARILDKSFVNGFWLGKNAFNSAANSWGGGIRESSPPYGRYLTLTDGQWHFLVFRRSGTTHTLYGDGIVNTTSGTVSSTPLSTSSMRIGIEFSTISSPLKGDISQVSIYNRALTPSEVLQNYNATKTRYGL
jgi:hypothetical protein